MNIWGLIMNDKLSLSDFDYPLDENKIAQCPPADRDGAKMLVMDRVTGRLKHDVFPSFAEYIRKEDVVVINDTKVLPARLIGHRPSKEERVELLLLKQYTDGIWECLGKPGKKLKPGTTVVFGDQLSAHITGITEDGSRLVRFEYEGVWEEVLDSLGEMPLPPYIHESLTDQTRYQTVYAKKDGSAAAPTAGLHFTREMFDRIRAKGAVIAPLTLHVGLGTFRPVASEELEAHKMHSEWYELPAQTIRAIRTARKQGGRVFAVGTTSMRVLETVGACVFEGEARTQSGWTDLFVRPGFRFSVVDALLTNFHLPKSTLLMLVSAFSTRAHVLRAYQEADRNDYRFFSFGDCMLILEDENEIQSA